MPRISMESVIDGDVLSGDVFVDDVFLFGAGTVLTNKRIEILKNLDVAFIEVEKRNKTYGSMKDVYTNIDKRFSYVEDIPIMMHVKSWIKDFLSNTGVVHETENNERNT